MILAGLSNARRATGSSTGTPRLSTDSDTDDGSWRDQSMEPDPTSWGTRESCRSRQPVIPSVITTTSGGVCAAKRGATGSRLKQQGHVFGTRSAVSGFRGHGVHRSRQRSVPGRHEAPTTSARHIARLHVSLRRLRYLARTGLGRCEPAPASTHDLNSSPVGEVE